VARGPTGYSNPRKCARNGARRSPSSWNASVCGRRGRRAPIGADAGGDPVRRAPFRAHHSVGAGHRRAALRALAIHARHAALVGHPLAAARADALAAGARAGPGATPAAGPSGSSATPRAGPASGGRATSVLVWHRPRIPSIGRPRRRAEELNGHMLSTILGPPPGNRNPARSRGHRKGGPSPGCWRACGRQAGRRIGLAGRTEWSRWKIRFLTASAGRYTVDVVWGLRPGLMKRRRRGGRAASQAGGFPASCEESGRTERCTSTAEPHSDDSKTGKEYGNASSWYGQVVQ
jgi:hypothetical protein